MSLLTLSFFFFFFFLNKKIFHVRATLCNEVQANLSWNLKTNFQSALIDQNWSIVTFLFENPLLIFFFFPSPSLLGGETFLKS